jgi:hypothetical protein
METNCIEEFPSSNNYRGLNFVYNKVNYELNASLYSNAIMIFILYNGKISKMYELNFDIEEEQEKNEYNFFCGDDDDNIKDIDIAQCILGKRGNEQIDFIANFIMSYIKDIVLKINSKINKICLALNLDEDLIKNIDNNNIVKDFINTLKDNIGKIFHVSKSD